MEQIEAPSRTRSKSFQQRRVDKQTTPRPRSSLQSRHPSFNYNSEMGFANVMSHFYADIKGISVFHQ